MSAIAELALINACTALVFAGVAAVLSLCIRRPAVAHLLWLVVLAELVVPPVIGLGVLPRTGHVARDAALLVDPSPVSVSPVAEAWSAVPSLETWLFMAWIAGSLWIALLAVTRGLRFVRLLREARPPDAELCARIARLASSLGLARPPQLRLVDAPISPFVWCLGRSSELVLPAALVPRLAPRELDAVLAHELAHLRRRDPWTRWLELAASVVFWWHPVSFWARARLRRYEERACDDLVLLTFPHIAPDYARGLVTTLELVARVERPLPALACGLGACFDMKERLTMILHRSPLPPLRRSSQRLLALALLAAVPFFPTWADRADDDRTAPPPTTGEDERQVLQERLEELELHAAELQAALGELRERQAELERRLHEGYGADGEDVGRAARDADAARLRQLELELVRQHAGSRPDLTREYEVRARALALEELRAAVERERDVAGEARGLVEQTLTRKLLAQQADELRAVAEELRAKGLADEAAELERRATELERRGTGAR